MHHYTLRGALASITTASLVLGAPSARININNKREVSESAAQEIEITALNGRFPTTGPYGTGAIASSLQITISYPVSDENKTTTCSYDWPATTPPGPTEWTACEDSTVQWRLPADGWTSVGNYRVEVFENLGGYGAGLLATHALTMSPGQPSDPNAYLSCLQMGKFTPYVCSIDGPLSAQRGPVVMDVEAVAQRPA